MPVQSRTKTGGGRLNSGNCLNTPALNSCPGSCATLTDVMDNPWRGSPQTSVKDLSWLAQATALRKGEKGKRKTPPLQETPPRNALTV